MIIGLNMPGYLNYQTRSNAFTFIKIIMGRNFIRLFSQR